MQETVRVDLGPRSYDVVIGSGLLDSAGDLLLPWLAGNRVAIVTDSAVGDLYQDRVTESLKTAGVDCVGIVLNAGEASKSWDSVHKVVEWLLQERIERDDAVVALGGGVVGDLAGFAAAILRRGVRHIQIPTTLLAQVDSSVGGKTGINSRHGKNLVGAFHQPAGVLADTATLATLSRRDFLSGYAEVAKYGLLGSAAFFAWLEANGASLSKGSPQHLMHAVRRSCEMKAELVRRDETEFGDRSLLNLGHTFGHALEAATGYSNRLLHGEAVAIGCGLAFDLSAKIGLCPPEVPARVRRHFRSMGMMSTLADIPGRLPDADGLMELMLQDKKVRQGQIRFVLARGIGQAVVVSDVDPTAVRAVLFTAMDDRQS